MNFCPTPSANRGGPNDHFSDDAFSYPWYTGATYPPAFYDAVGNKTWVFYEGGQVGGGRCVRARVYDHAIGVWSVSYVVATNALQNDDHGVPSAAMDSAGRVHVFYGSHATPLKRCFTTNPRDPSAWTAEADIGMTLSYPHPTIIGSSLYLFCRYDVAPQTDMALAYIKGTIAGDGTTTYGTGRNVGDLGADSRFYQGPHILVGTDIHILATRANAADTERKNVYYLIFDTVAETVYNFDRSVSVVSGSQPIGLTQLNASFKIVDQPTNNGNIPSFCRDAAGNTHVLYMDGGSSVYGLYYLVNSGAGWSTPLKVGDFPTLYANTADFHRYDGFSVVPASDGGVDIYWVIQGTPTFDRGGDIATKHRTAAGVWGSQSTVRSSTTFRALDTPSGVRDMHPNLRLVFGEVIQQAGFPQVNFMAVGNLKCYAVGDAGLVKVQA